MATFKRCDRCHFESGDEDKFTTLQIPHEPMYPGADRNTKLVELCNDCLQHVHEQIKPIPKKR